MTSFCQLRADRLAQLPYQNAPRQLVSEDNCIKQIFQVSDVFIDKLVKYLLLQLYNDFKIKLICRTGLKLLFLFLFSYLLVPKVVLMKIF